MRLISTLIFSAGLLLSLAANAQLVSSTSRPVLVIRDTDTQQTAQVGNLVGGSAGLKLASATPVTLTAVFSHAPFTDDFLVESRTQAEIENAFSQWVHASQRPPLFDTVHAFVSDYGLSHAWYYFERSATINGAPGTVSWSFFQDADGRTSWGNLQIASTAAPDEERTLRVRYEAATVAAGLEPYIGPADHNPNGGQIVWQVLDENLNPVGGAGMSGSINVGGAFDLPPSGDVNVTAVLEDIANSAEVQNLMATKGAGSIQIEYAYAPEARYGMAPKAVCPGGTACPAPLGVWTYQTRELEYIDCGREAQYTNDGKYQLELEYVTDLYALDQGNSPRLIDRQVRHERGVQKSFSGTRTLTLSQAANVIADDRLVLSPLSPATLIDARVLVGTYNPKTLTVVGQANQGPEKPTLSAPGTVDADTEITLTWAPKGCITPTRYELRVRPAGGSWQTVYSGNKKQATYTVGSAASYEFNLRACDGNDCSGWVKRAVNVNSCEMLAPRWQYGDLNDHLYVDLTPIAPGTFPITWEPDPASCETPAYYVLRGKTTSGSNEATKQLTATTDVWSGPLGVTWRFEVKACTAAGDCSGWSFTKEVLVPPYVP